MLVQVGIGYIKGQVECTILDLFEIVAKQKDRCLSVLWKFWRNKLVYDTPMPETNYSEHCHH